MQYKEVDAKSLEVVIPADFAVNVATDLRENIIRRLERGLVHLVFDFSECRFIDSTGLGVMVGLSKRLAEKQGTLKLKGVGGDVAKVIRMTRLDQVFDIVWKQ